MRRRWIIVALACLFIPFGNTHAIAELTKFCGIFKGAEIVPIDTILYKVEVRSVVFGPALPKIVTMTVLSGGWFCPSHHDRDLSVGEWVEVYGDYLGEGKITICCQGCYMYRNQNCRPRPKCPHVLPLLCDDASPVSDDCVGTATHITQYWGDAEWQNKTLAEDGDWNTCSSVNVANKILYANHTYNGQGSRLWRFKYSSSGYQYTVFECYDYGSNAWTGVLEEKSYVSGNTVTMPIPSGCLKADSSIQLRVRSATSAQYYEGYILCP